MVADVAKARDVGMKLARLAMQRDVASARDADVEPAGDTEIGIAEAGHLDVTVAGNQLFEID